MSQLNPEENTSPDKISLPFNNLFLNEGFLSGDNRLSKYILTILVTLLAYFSYQILMGFVIIYLMYLNSNQDSLMEFAQNIATHPPAEDLFKTPDKYGISKNTMLLLFLGMFVFTFWSFYLAIKNFHQKKLLSLITAFPNIRWKQVGVGFLVWALVFVMMFVVDAFILSPENYVWNYQSEKFWKLVIISSLFIPIQATFEEVFFRGYLLQGWAMASKKGWNALFFTSLLFGLAHMSNPEADAYGSWIMLPFYTLFGLFLGLLALWNNGLELSIGIHTANNVISAILVTSDNSVLQTDALYFVKNENPVMEFVLWIFGAIVAYLIFNSIYKFKNKKGLLN